MRIGTLIEVRAKTAPKKTTSYLPTVGNFIIAGNGNRVIAGANNLLKAG